MYGKLSKVCLVGVDVSDCALSDAAKSQWEMNSLDGVDWIKFSANGDWMDLSNDEWSSQEQQSQFIVDHDPGHR